MLLGGEECEISSPIHRTENKFVVNNEPINQRAETSTSEDKPRRGLSRLADLAQNINQWEDEIVTVSLKYSHTILLTFRGRGVSVTKSSSFYCT